VHFHNLQDLQAEHYGFVVREVRWGHIKEGTKAVPEVQGH
jgi:hypothetical protein